MINKAGKLLDYLIDFVFPKVCILTGERLPDDNSNSFIKDEAIENLDKLSQFDLSKLKEKLNNINCFSLYRFKDDSPIQTLIHSLKYNGLKDLGVLLGELVAKELIQNNYTYLKNYDFIIPIPLHKSKLRERGYNQSDYIARGINKYFNLEYNDYCFIRKKDTKSQTKLSIEERYKNLKDAFDFVPEHKKSLKGKKIILVDDIITTGATVKEAQKTLLKGGVTEIFSISVALTVFD